MTTPIIYEWPTEWYRFTKSTFRLTSRSQVTPNTWIGGKTVYGPHAQLWLAQFTIVVSRQDDDYGQDMAAFFSRLGGQAGLLRISDPARLDLRYNRQITAANEAFSDGTLFTDGTGFEDDLQPAYGSIALAAERGDNNLVISGLLEMTANSLARGDLIEVRPNGVATEVPNLYEVQVPGSTGTGGMCGVEVRPRLRQDFAVGDQVVFRRASTVFRVIDDDQGAADVELPLKHYTSSFSAVEAII